MRAYRLFLVPLAALVLALPALADDAAVNTLTAEEKAAGFELLFDGRDMSKLRNYRQDEVNDKWVIEDDAIAWKAGGAGDLVTRDKYASFELVLDYRISEGGNSGIMFHVTEDGDAPWFSGPEIQVQDNVQGHDPQKAGWLYQLYSAETDATKPAGEWNTLRVIVTKGKSETWMNGVKYYEYEKGSADWKERVAKSKFGSMKSFGAADEGHICLQDHGNPVWFRNVKIRRIDD